MSETDSDAAARTMLNLPAAFDVPSADVVVQDARAILLQMLSLRKDVQASGMVLSPVWENVSGQASMRAAIVPPQVAARFYEGPGLVSLRDATVMDMMGDVVVMLLEDPVGAARVLATTEQLWISETAPTRSLQLPFKPHFKVLTLVVADFARKIGAGFTELEWLASLGLLAAYHDPSGDPPKAEVLAATHAKTAAMCAEEEEWMRALQAEA